MSDAEAQPYCFEMTRRVEFVETDTAGIVHYTSFLHYLEEAEHAFLRSAGLSVMLKDERGQLGFPRVEVSSRYFRALQFEDELQIKLQVLIHRGKLLEYCGDFFHEDQKAAVARIKVACCRVREDGRMFAILPPEFLLERLRRNGARFA